MTVIICLIVLGSMRVITNIMVKHSSLKLLLFSEEEKTNQVMVIP